MSREIAVLLFLVSTLPNSAIGGDIVLPTEQVQCYSDTTTSSSTNCTGVSIGDMTALDCCSGNGSTFTFSNQCLGCVLVGFTVTELNFTPDDAGTTAMVELEVEKAIGIFSLQLNVSSVNFSKNSSSEINGFVADYPNDETFMTSSTTSRQFPLTISSAGNSKALEEPLEFFVLASPVSVSGNVGLIISQPTVRITVADLDVIEFSFETLRGSNFTEGATGSVVVVRNAVRPSRPVTVFVTARRLSNIKYLVMGREFIADDTDFILGETKEYTFTDSEESRLQQSFSAVDDNIVEQGIEVFEVFLTSNEPLVKISQNRSVQWLFIQDDDDAFQIGFWRSQIVVTEGDEVSVTIVQTNNVTGQLRLNDDIEVPLIENEKVNTNPADEGIDYILKTETVRNMKISATTKRLIPINVNIGSINHDNVVEGKEEFILRVKQSNFLQVGDNSSLSISIRDATAAEVKLQKPVYNASESSFSLDVCAEIVAKDNISLTANLKQKMVVSATLMDNTAKSPDDYFNEDVEFSFRGQRKQVCSPVFIESDTIKEGQENFTITLGNLLGDAGSYFTNVSVNEDPSYIVILDDDGADVYFEQEFATFSEADGDQDIYLLYIGDQPSENIVVEVYDIDTGMVVGQVTFTPSPGNQRMSFSLSIPDNNIALEPNRILNLGINKSQSFDIGTPSNMTITIVDDDVVAVDFVSGSYSFSEGASQSSGISLKLSLPIAQSLSVQVVGVVSGTAVDSTVTFPSGQAPLMLPAFTINDDNTGLETDEIFQLQLLSSSPSNNVSLGDPANITITDDDNTTITFANAEYTFLENAGETRRVTVELNREVARDFTVRVSGNTIPLAQGVVDSGSNVNELITFTAYNSSQSNLQQIVEVKIVDDSVSGEPNQTYTLTLSQQPSDVVVSPYSTTTIIIIDVDSSGVRFEPFMGPLLESAQMYDLTVHLDGEISDPVSVDVLDANGNLVSTVMFRPISGQTTQSKVVTVTFTDDENALEDTETLTFSLSNPNGVTVSSPSTVNVLVTDDDVVTVTFSNRSNTFYEYELNPEIGVQIDKTIDKDLEVSVLGEPPTSGIAVSGQPVNTTVTFKAQDVMLKTFFIDITNDDIAGENDENYKLKFVKSSPSDGIILGPDATVTIIDEDILTYGIPGEPNVVYPENGGNQVFNITISPYARSLTFNLTSVLIGPVGFVKSLGSIECSGATNGILQLPPSSTTVEINCIVEVMDDQVTDEDDEIYRFEISLISPDPETVSVNPGTTKLNLTIEDDDEMHTRTCQYSSTTQNISTFGDSNTYQYNRTCEHALLKQMTTIGELGVYIDSLDGTFMTTRVGVRIGLYESIVVGAYTRTVIRQNSLSHIAFTSTSTKLSITVSSVDLTIEITASGISVIVVIKSELQKHMGLCGDLNGEFTSRNVDLSNMTSLNRMISRFLTPPSETFIINVVRPKCGLVREDLETGDPLFVVPLYTPSAAKRHSYSLCYEIHGYGNETYNFISDECTQVSAHYYETTYPDPNITRAFHGVDEIHITAVNNRQQCVSITVSLKNKVHSTSVGGSPLVGKYLQSGISVRQIANNRTRISVPNCADNRLIMNVISRNLDTTIPFFDFKVVRGLNLRESSHGLIGQFWNVRTSVTKYTKPLRDSIIYNDTYLIEIMPRNSPKRSFIGFLYEKTWNFGEFPCLYVGNAEGGPIGEVADGEPNDSLIEGTMNKYSTSNFSYNHFDEVKCKIDNVDIN